MSCYKLLGGNLYIYGVLERLDLIDVIDVYKNNRVLNYLFVFSLWT